MTDYRCGMVTLVGRPNVGKSTLLNRLVGTKVSITSPRPQTTRHRLLGIKTDAAAQIIYVDTPGLHPAQGSRLGQHMNRAARGSLEGVDVVMLVITADGWTAADEYPLTLVAGLALPVVLVINKIDLLTDRATLLPLIEASAARFGFAEIVPVAARRGDNVDTLERALIKYLPAQPPIYPADQLTDRSERFLAAELVREQVFRSFGQEVPYAVAVQIEKFQRTKSALHIAATLWVEKEGQKAILIGTGGAQMKTVGTRARLAMQKTFGGKVHLELWVKVRERWSDDERALRTLGYEGD
ncbi:MAG: GTPase Era [Candidatus Muproteobacteria bacterium RBG_16_64_10]|uniref:GTPase Era n=1 Tax=Candidatus Muproteobacteria bacterium RBG_16_64_10 TaxID=1817757 RepID=A0A1F6T3F8_9PROT|nr:MAG: GTPase Era [Candidatus Muproteobacteria bacterium RBG_16_64_10]